MQHDFEEQRRETFETFAELKRGGEEMPSASVLEVYLLCEGADSDWEGCAKALGALGFRCTRDEGEQTLIAATAQPIAISAEKVWEQELAATKAGLRYGFHPDGWEFGFE